MTGTLIQPERPVADSSRPGSPDLSLLQDRVPDALKLPRVLAGMTAVVGGLFWFLSLQPLHHTDVWGHLAYGREIWNTGRLPDTEPLMPLAAGVKWINTAWLTQVLGYAAVRGLGLQVLQALYAGSIALCAGLLLWGLYRRTRSAWAGLLGVGAFLLVDWQQLLVIRPQLAGLVAFVALVVLFTSARRHWSHWVLIPVIFALWANLHGSFIVGLLLMACLSLGRALDVFRRTGRFRAVWRDDSLRRMVLLTELAAAAVLVNPYGLALYGEVLTFSENSNLADLTEWQSLTFRSLQGQSFVAAALFLTVLYRLTPRRVPVSEVIPLVVFGLASLWTARMIVWWGPLAAYAIALHSHAVVRHRWKVDPVPSPRSGKWTVVTVGLAWIAFAYTPFGLSWLHSEQPVELRKLVTPYTPVGAVEYLRQQPLRGQIFNIYEWGDFLLWEGPPKVPVFVASHAHLVPPAVWRDYMRVIELRSGWEDVLDRYGVNTVLLDQAFRRGLIQQLKQDPRWTVGYEDVGSVVFVRKEPI